MSFWTVHLNPGPSILTQNCPLLGLWTQLDRTLSLKTVHFHFDPFWAIVQLTWTVHFLQNRLLSLRPLLCTVVFAARVESKQKNVLQYIGILIKNFLIRAMGFSWKLTKDVETNVLHSENQIFIKIQNSNFVQFLEHQTLHGLTWLLTLINFRHKITYEIIF